MHLLEQRRWQLLLDIADETEDGLPCKKATSSQISRCNAQETSGSFLKWLELHIIPPNSFKPMGFPVSRTSQVHQFLELAREPLHWGRSYVVSYRKSFWVRCQGIPDGYLYFYYDTLDLGKLCPKSSKISDICSVKMNNTIYVYIIYNEIILFQEEIVKIFWTFWELVEEEEV